MVIVVKCASIQTKHEYVQLTLLFAKVGAEGIGPILEAVMGARNWLGTKVEAIVE